MISLEGNHNTTTINLTLQNGQQDETEADYSEITERGLKDWDNFFATINQFFRREDC